MEQKLNAAKLIGLTPSQVLSETPTRFYSNAKAPLHTLSNLYGCSCVVEGHEFVSAEHAYQALQKMSDISDWIIGGRFSDWDEVYRIVNADRASKKLKPLSAGRWKKKNQIGILAILVIRRSELFGLQWKPRNDALSISYEHRWRPIFEAKYSDPTLRQTLMATQGPLIEFKRGGHKEMLKAFNNGLAAGMSMADANAAAQRAELWGAYNIGTEVWGQNVTGKNLTRFRDELLARKRSNDTAQPVSKRAKFKQFVLQ